MTTSFMRLIGHAGLPVSVGEGRRALFVYMYIWVRVVCVCVCLCVVGGGGIGCPQLKNHFKAENNRECSIAIAFPRPSSNRDAHTSPWPPYPLTTRLGAQQKDGRAVMGYGQKGVCADIGKKKHGQLTSIRACAPSCRSGDDDAVVTYDRSLLEALYAPARTFRDTYKVGR